MRIAVIALTLAVILTLASLWGLIDRVRTLEYCFNTPLNERDEERCNFND